MKNNTPRGKIIFLLSIALAFAVAVFVYKQPVEIEDICGWDFDRCTQIAFRARYDEGEFQKHGRMKEYLFTLEKGEAGFDEIMSLLKGKTVKRLLWTFVSTETKPYPAEKGEFMWNILLNGTIEIDNFYGQQVTVRLLNEDKQHILAIDKNDPWLKEIFDTAVKYAK